MRLGLGGMTNASIDIGSGSSWIGRACSFRPGGCLGGEAMDLQAARMNALAGGPISARDAELLERYGCESGTRNAFCQALNHPRRYYRPRRRAYQH